MKPANYFLFTIAFLIISLLKFSTLTMAMGVQNWMLYTIKVKCDNSSKWVYLKPVAGKIDCHGDSGITVTRGKETGECVEVFPNDLYVSLPVNLHKHCVHLPRLGRCGGFLVPAPVRTTTINGFPTAAYFLGLVSFHPDPYCPY